MHRRFRLALFVTALMCAVASPVPAVDNWTQIMPGVQHLHRVVSVPNNIHALVIDLTNPHVRVRVGIKNDHDKGDGGETVQSMCGRYGAVAGVNGDFWGGSPVSHCPQGHCYIDGLRMLPPGRVSPLNGNRTTMQISSGNYVLINTVSITPTWWHNVVAGGPRVLRNGVVGWENESDIPDMTVRAPRTGGAVSADYKTLILATCDGRSAASAGMTGNEMGALLKELGGHNGMMFDGGGSTTMVIDGATVNVPSDGQPRAVANCLMVLDSFSQGDYPTVHYETGFECASFPPGPIAGSDGWTGAGVITGSPHTGSQSAAFAGAGAWKSVFSGLLMGTRWVECWAAMSAATGVGSLYTAGSTTSDIASVVRFSGPNIEALDGNGSGGGTWTTVLSNASTGWYRIGIRLDYAIDRYSVYVNGALKASGFGFQTASAGSGLRWIGFGESTGSATLSIDDIYAGSVDPEFVRVSLDTAAVVLGGGRQFDAISGAEPLVWSVIEEKNPGGSTVPPGAVAAIDASGLLVAYSAGTCRIRVQDSSGRVDESETVTIVPSQRVYDLKNLPDGSPAAVFGLRVSGVFDGFLYAQTPGEVSGIRVRTDASAGLGDLIAVTGVIRTIDGERVICADNCQVVGL